MFDTWRGWLTAVSAIAGFAYGMLVWLRAIELWQDSFEPGYDAYVSPPSWPLLLMAALLIVGAVGAVWKESLVLMAGWTLLFCEMIYASSFLYVPPLREPLGMPPPDFKDVLSSLLMLAVPVAGVLLPLPARLHRRIRT